MSLEEKLKHSEAMLKEYRKKQRLALSKNQSKQDQLVKIGYDRQSNYSKEQRHFDVLKSYSGLSHANDRLRLRVAGVPVEKRQASQCCQISATLVLTLITFLLVGSFHDTRRAF